MSELEPTRTYSNPTATDELRRMLDERGVEYSYEDVTEGTLFVVTRDVRIYYILAREKGFKVWSDWLTPAQAIAATFGSCNRSSNCTNSERTETCHPVISDNLNESEGMGDAWADCSECGHLLFVLTDPNSEPPNYCPNCGARCVW